MKQLCLFLFSLSVISCLVVQCDAQDELTIESAAIETDALLDGEGKEALQKISQRFTEVSKTKGEEKVKGIQEIYFSLEKLAKNSPNLAPARTLWAKLLISAGDGKSARSTLQQSIAEYPDDPEAYVILAQLAVASGQLAESDAICDVAVKRIESWSEKHPRRRPLLAQVAASRVTIAQSRSGLTKQLRQNGLATSYDRQAVEQLREWIRLAPDNAKPHERLAEEMIKRGNLSEAEKEFELARAISPELPLTALRVAKALLLLGQIDDGVARIDRVLAEHPDDVQSLVTAADLLLAIGEIENARRHVSAALAIEPQQLAARRLLGQIQRFESDRSAASETLQELNTDYPADFETANLLALTLSESDEVAQRSRAVSIATVNAQRFRTGSLYGLRSRVTLVWAIYRAGQMNVAQKAFSQLLAGGIRSKLLSGDEAYYLAKLAVEFGRSDLALPLLNSVLKRVTQFPKRGDAAALQNQLSQ